MKHRPGIDASLAKRMANADRYAMALWKHIESWVSLNSSSDIYHVAKLLNERGFRARRGGPVTYHTVFRTIERIRKLSVGLTVCDAPAASPPPSKNARPAEPIEEIVWLVAPISIEIGTRVKTNWGEIGIVVDVVGDGFALKVRLESGRVVRKARTNLLVKAPCE